MRVNQLPQAGMSVTQEECGVDFSDDKLVESYKYVCDGILVSIVGLVGILGNVTALLVLSRPKLRDCFHQLLLALACFDTIYIVFGGINYTMRAFELAGSRLYTITFPYIIYPFTNIGITGTIFMTVAISIERFLGVCYPLLLPPTQRKSWFYILPVLILSVAVNVPKFFEAEVTWHDDISQLQVLIDEIGLNFTAANVNLQYTPSNRPTSLRVNSNYIKYYIVYFRLFFMAVVPLLLMIFLNAKIVCDIKSAQVQRFGSKRKMSKEVNFSLVLLCIVITFLCCHAPRTLVDMWEFSHLEDIVECNEKLKENLVRHQFLPTRWVVIMTHVSHFTAVLNSSINFLIYCFVGRNFRKEFFRLLGLRSEYSRPCPHSLLTAEQRAELTKLPET